MKYKVVIAFVCFGFFYTRLHARQNVGIGTSAPAASAMLDIKSNTKGLLIPRMSAAERLAIADPEKGLLVFQINDSSFYYNAGSTVKPAWVKLSDNKNVWNTNGNPGTDPLLNFIGTTDNQPLFFKVNNIEAGFIAPTGSSLGLGLRTLLNNTGTANTAFGFETLKNNTTGFSNSAFGNVVLLNNTTGLRNIGMGNAALLANTTGMGNTALGYSSLSQNTTGHANVAVGIDALKTSAALSNQVAVGDSALFNLNGGSGENTAIGSKALHLSTIGAFNAALGYQSLYSNIDGDRNTASGYEALYSNSTGNRNTSVGFRSLRLNRDGNGNVALGHAALYNNTVDRQVAVGDSALFNNTTGENNTAVGAKALFSNTTQVNNTAVGYEALYSNGLGGGSLSNTAIGYQALKTNSTGSRNTSIGAFTMTSNIIGHHNIAVGTGALSANTTGDDNIAIGLDALNFNTTGEFNTAIGSGANVLLNGLTNATVIGAGATISSNNAMSFGNTDVTRWAFGLFSTGPGKAIEVGSTNLNGNGAFLTNGGVWTNTSDANKKENFTDLNANDLLQKIAQLKIQRWRYKGSNEYHIGPTAQDFYQLFELGVDDKGISTVDPAGIALAAIKEQQRLIENQNEQILQLQKRLDALEKK